MKYPRLTTLLLALVFTSHATAAKLTPYQEAALNKLLATAPAEQRAMMRPHLEQTLSSLSNQHIDMMLAGIQKQDAPAPAAARDNQKEAGPWGAAEADFDKAFALAQGYIARISDVRDTAGPTDLCRNELLQVPIGRKKHAAMAQLQADQDRLMLRTMVEHRVMNKSAAQFAKSIGAPESNELVQSMRHYFEAPMAEAEVKAKLVAVQAEAARLAAAHERERLQIVNGNYADRGHGVFSKIEEDKLAALQARTAKATKALCEPALGYYQRGLVYFIDPAVVPKVRN